MVVEQKVKVKYLRAHNSNSAANANAEAEAEVTTTCLPMLGTANDESRTAIQYLIKQGEWVLLQKIIESQFCPRCAINDAEIARKSKSNFIDVGDCRLVAMTVEIPAEVIQHAFVQGLSDATAATTNNLGDDRAGIEARLSDAQAERAARAALDQLFQSLTITCFYAVYTILRACPHADASDAPANPSNARPVAVVLTSDGGMNNDGSGYLSFKVAIPATFSADDEIQLAASIGVNNAQIAGSTAAQSISKLSWTSELVAFTI